MNSKNFDALAFIRSVRYLTRGHTGEFEHKCGVCRGYLARAEQGQIHTMSINTALGMAVELGYRVEELADPDFIKKRRIAEIDAQIAKLTEERDSIK
ncbi:MAG: hypothetical protein II008_13720 [Oscillospiraceae bacterium]|nr:hypothetical protein [Oscillospiraceae bacterium]